LARLPVYPPGGAGGTGLPVLGNQDEFLVTANWTLHRASPGFSHPSRSDVPSSEDDDSAPAWEDPGPSRVLSPSTDARATKGSRAIRPSDQSPRWASPFDSFLSASVGGRLGGSQPNGHPSPSAPGPVCGGHYLTPCQGRLDSSRMCEQHLSACPRPPDFRGPSIQLRSLPAGWPRLAGPRKAKRQPPWS
jgi:hypothetical protein